MVEWVYDKIVKGIYIIGIISINRLITKLIINVYRVINY